MCRGAHWAPACTKVIMENIVRKKIRLDKYDYSSTGSYFLTICVDKHKNILWNKSAEMISCNDILLPLSDYGIIVNDAVKQITVHYPDVYVDKYVIMPNHLHLILIIGASNSDCKSCNVSSIINQLKGAVTKKIGFSIWQKSYYDHIIRGENDYNEICSYIENNPYKWDECHN